MVIRTFKRAKGISIIRVRGRGETFFQPNHGSKCFQEEETQTNCAREIKEMFLVLVDLGIPHMRYDGIR